jgi:hypothetical protein
MFVLVFFLHVNYILSDSERGTLIREEPERPVSTVCAGVRSQLYSERKNEGYSGSHLQRCSVVLLNTEEIEE